MYNIGLIGNFISKSQMPDLISRLGKDFDIPIKYELFDLKDQEKIDLEKIILQLKKKILQDLI